MDFQVRLRLPVTRCSPAFCPRSRRELTAALVGDNNVPPVLTDPVLGRSRHSGPPRRGFRPQRHLERRPIALCQSEESFGGKFRCRWFHSGAVVAEGEGHGQESWDIPHKDPFHESEAGMVEVVLECV